jgi:hypothetical protein
VMGDDWSEYGYGEMTEGDGNMDINRDIEY